ncbi:MAG: TnsA endonuclease N-terminal domain-containing protein, partial [Hydrogenophilaceae bacterium]
MVTRRITSNPATVTGTAATDQKYESTLEQDYFVLLRFDPWVEKFIEQPITVPWTDQNGKVRKYTPDVLVHFRSDVAPEDRRPPLLVEVKPDLDEEGRTMRRRG